MIRLSFCYFFVGTVLGAFMLINKVISFNLEVWKILPIHIEMMIFGWIIQFTVGTGYWMLPRLVKGKPRGNETIAFLIPLVLNLGIIIIISSYLIFQSYELRLVGRALEALIVPIFITLHWKRVSKQIHT
ncbi:MAG: cbb3-type cytochrome c oxidase subunit I [Balneolaceae bacterium]